MSNWIIVFHLLFAAFLVLLVWAMSKQGERMEMLVKGLDLARRADAEAARNRLSRMMEAQAEQQGKMLKLLRDAEIARKQCELAIGTGRTGNGHSAQGHRKG